MCNLVAGVGQKIYEIQRNSLEIKKISQLSINKAIHFLLDFIES